MMKYSLAAMLIVLFLQPASAQRKYNKTTTDPLQVYMTSVKGGSFDLGSNDEADDRKPAHTVTLKDFSIGTYEVTQLLWRTIMGTNPSTYKCDDCPVNNVSWNDVQTFIRKLNERTGRHYRLPTEAEWEYAARGGSREVLVKKYPNVARGGVNEFLISDQGARVPDKNENGKRYAGERRAGEVAWYDRNSESHVHRVGTKHANELGIYDMSGNVEEWCADYYGKNYGSKNSVENPTGPSGGNAHVVRGGSYQNGTEELAVTRRAAYVPNTKSMALGFRLAEDR
jgi:formylglycine-generating enzyme